MATEFDIYKIRAQIEKSIAAVFTANEITAISRVNALTDFQKIRPRVEVKAKIGAVTGHRNVCPDGLVRYDEYRISVAIQTVVNTAADGEDNTNEQFVSKARELMSTLAQYSFADATNFPNLFLCLPFKDSGTNDTLKAEDGCEYTVLSYDSIVKIRETAWPTSTT